MVMLMPERSAEVQKAYKASVVISELSNQQRIGFDPISDTMLIINPA